MQKQQELCDEKQQELCDEVDSGYKSRDRFKVESTPAGNICLFRPMANCCRTI
ncbi:hypothetical protein J6590_084128 [Homalodisca vitripennis]|nr:hypothetical protein J6590_084128 [Homalodisca vitripennis]